MRAWSAELRGRLEESTITSEALRGNALGDLHERPVWMYLLPTYGDEPSENAIEPTVELRRLDGRPCIRQRPQPPGAQFVNTVIGLLGADALPARSTATMVTVLAPRTSV
jgi:hypothetical protein